MSAICAVFSRDRQPVDARLVADIMSASPGRSVHGERAWADERVAIGHQHFHVTREECSQEQPLCTPDAQAVVAADARIDNRSEVGKLLGIRPSDLAQLSDAGLILAAYRHWSRECPRYLLGDFAFLIWDVRKQTLFGARDALGARGLNYFINDRVALFSSEVATLLVHPAVHRQINDRKIAEFLTDIPADEGATFYRDIQTLSPGHSIAVTPESITVRRFWSADPTTRIRYSKDSEYAEHYRALLVEAVRCRMRSTGPIGVSLSGGLDSAPIAGVLASLLPSVRPEQRGLRTYSYVFDRYTQCDERRYFEPLIARYGMDATYVPCDDKWTFRDFPKWPGMKDMVFADAFAWLPDAVRHAASRDGVRLLFAGYFGDTLFLLGRYWLADILCRRTSWRTFVNPSLRQVIRPDMSETKEQLFSLSPKSVRLRYLSKRAKRLRTVYPCLHPALAKRTNLDGLVAGNVAGASTCDDTFTDRVKLLHLARTADGLAAARRQYHEYGLELAQPFMDRRLVEFCLYVPADQLMRPGQDRVLARNALRGIVTEDIRLREGKTTFAPLFKTGIEKQARNVVEDLVTNPRVVADGYVDGKWLQRQYGQMGKWPDDGYRFWNCLSLEVWLRKYW